MLGGEGAEGLFVGVVLQVHDDVGAVLGALGRLDVVAVDTVGFPGPGLIRPDGTRDDAHLATYHEGGIEAHAELADDVHVGKVAEPLGLAGLAFGGSFRLGGLELEGVGMGDSAKIAIELVFGHADAVVGHGDRAGFGIVAHGNGQVIAAHGHGRISEAAEVELIHGIRGVGDKLAQEDLAIGVDGVDHEVEQFLALGLELAHRAFLLSYEWERIPPQCRPRTGKVSRCSSAERQSLTCGDIHVSSLPLRVLIAHCTQKET